MGIGKMLGFAAMGVAAVAAAPFTGGGSILAATTAAGSLAGAGALAAGAGAIGAVTGAALSKKEEREEREKQEKIAEAKLKAEKATEIIEEHKAHYETIIALTALGVAMANVDGEISKEERIELDEFVGGVASLNYPEHIKNTIKDIVANPPTFNEAIKHLEKVPSVEYQEIRNLLVLVMEADGIEHPKEKAFIAAYDAHIELAG